MRFSTLALLTGLSMAGSAASSIAAVSASEYRASLLEIYGRYQGVLALRDACNSAFPKLQSASDKAFAAWQARHKRSHEELDQRIALMIRAYSKDDKDYSRNFGKYQGGFVRQREEAKQALMQESRGELEIRCRGLPQFLQSRESDLETEFANEWLVLRQWQVQQQK
jgi:hypothetical protein